LDARIQATGKSPEPADKNVCATWRRLSSLRVAGTFQSPLQNGIKIREQLLTAGQCRLSPIILAECLIAGLDEKRICSPQHPFAAGSRALAHGS
jgi:hypothetical protein